MKHKEPMENNKHEGLTSSELPLNEKVKGVSKRLNNAISILIAIGVVAASVFGYCAFIGDKNTVESLIVQDNALTKSYFTTDEKQIDWEPARMLVYGKADVGIPPQIQISKDKIMLSDKVFDIIDIQELEVVTEGETRFLIQTKQDKEMSIISGDTGILAVSMGSITMLYKEKIIKE